MRSSGFIVAIALALCTAVAGCKEGETDTNTARFEKNTFKKNPKDKGATNSAKKDEGAKHDATNSSPENVNTKRSPGVAQPSAATTPRVQGDTIKRKR